MNWTARIKIQNIQIRALSPELTKHILRIESLDSKKKTEYVKNGTTNQFIIKKVKIDHSWYRCANISECLSMYCHGATRRHLRTKCDMRFVKRKTCTFRKSDCICGWQ